MLRYRFYLLDADETLLDFPLAQKNAVSITLSAMGWPVGDADIARFDAINAHLWKLRETGGITQDELIIRRFTEFFAGDARYDGQTAAQRYIAELSRQAPVYPGVSDILQKLKEQGVRTAIVTNGVGVTQRGRLAASGLAPYIDELVISQDIGAFKPDPKMIDVTLARLGCARKEEAVMVGDNIATDILAAQRAGVDACWYNPSGAELPQDAAPPTYDIRALEEILSL